MSSSPMSLKDLVCNTLSNCTAHCVLNRIFLNLTAKDHYKMVNDKIDCNLFTEFCQYCVKNGMDEFMRDTSKDNRIGLLTGNDSVIFESIKFQKSILKLTSINVIGSNRNYATKSLSNESIANHIVGYLDDASQQQISLLNCLFFNYFTSSKLLYQKTKNDNASDCNDSNMFMYHLKSIKTRLKLIKTTTKWKLLLDNILHDNNNLLKTIILHGIEKYINDKCEKLQREKILEYINLIAYDSYKNNNNNNNGNYNCSCNKYDKQLKSKRKNVSMTKICKTITKKPNPLRDSPYFCVVLQYFNTIEFVTTISHLSKWHYYCLTGKSCQFTDIDPNYTKNAPPLNIIKNINKHIDLQIKKEFNIKKNQEKKWKDKWQSGRLVADKNNALEYWSSTATTYAHEVLYYLDDAIGKQFYGSNNLSKIKQCYHIITQKFHPFHCRSIVNMTFTGVAGYQPMYHQKTVMPIYFWLRRFDRLDCEWFSNSMKRIDCLLQTFNVQIANAVLEVKNIQPRFSESGIRFVHSFCGIGVRLKSQDEQNKCDDKYKLYFVEKLEQSKYKQPAPTANNKSIVIERLVMDEGCGDATLNRLGFVFDVLKYHIQHMIEIDLRKKVDCNVIMKNQNVESKTDNNQSSEQESKQANTFKTCPKMHGLWRNHLDSYTPYQCDECGRSIRNGKVMYSCRRCNWDLCDSCFGGLKNYDVDEAYKLYLSTNSRYPWNIINDQLLNRIFYVENVDSGNVCLLFNSYMIENLLCGVMHKLFQEIIFVELKRDVETCDGDKIVKYILFSCLQCLKQIFQYIDKMKQCLNQVDNINNNINDDQEKLAIKSELESHFDETSDKWSFKSLSSIFKQNLKLLLNKYPNCNHYWNHQKQMVIGDQHSQYQHVFCP